jgi:hypothetical protein
MYIEYKEERTCKKCNTPKDLNEFCDMVNLSKSYDCKECRNAYTREYYKRNKERIIDNNRLYRNRAKKDKKQMRNYTDNEKKYITSKITSIKWEEISESLRTFWLEWRDKNEIPRGKKK